MNLHGSTVAVAALEDVIRSKAAPGRTSRLTDQLAGLERENAVTASDLDDPGVVLGLREVLAQESIPQAPKLVAVEVADKRVH